MKKIVTLLLAAGLMLGGAHAAQAVDIKLSGQWDFTAQWGDWGTDKNEHASNNSFYQCLVTQIDIIASEALSGVVTFEIGDTVWGSSPEASGADSGGALGADGVNISVKHAFLDWIPPHTDLQIRVGLQEIVLPGMEESSQIFNDDVAGIVMNYAFTDNVSATVWWARPFADNADSSTRNPGNRMYDDMDMFGVAVPLTFDGVSVTPWGMYASVGRDIYAVDADGELRNQGDTSFNHYRQMMPRWADVTDPGFHNADGQSGAWWLGLTGDITVWDPFRLAFDFNYGSVDMGDARVNGTRYDLKRSGWYAALLAEYAFECVTPGLVAWYASGDDGDWRDGSEMMPTIKSASPFTTFGQDGADMNFGGTAFQTGLAGTWGLVARLNDISFVEDLTHQIQVAYYRGTNDKKMAKVMGDPWSSAPASDDAYTYMTEKDSAWEVNVNTYYQIYTNLKAGLELGYIKLNLSESTWGSAVDNREESAWKVGLGLQYSF